MTTPKLIPAAWIALKHPDQRIMDPDGWRPSRREPNGKSLAEPISEEEFDRRWSICTIGPKLDTEESQADERAYAEFPDIHELFRLVRSHPDYVFGTIFTVRDFPGGVVPEDFSPEAEEEMLVQYGNEHIQYTTGDSE